VRNSNILVIILIFFNIFSVLQSVGICGAEDEKTLTVRSDGNGNYTSIQDAIDAASPGDTVYVWSGTYYEPLIVNKTINLIGEDKNTTILDCNNYGYSAIRIQAFNVTISSFTIQNSTTGIYIEGNDIRPNNITITDTIITKNKGGIFLGNLSNNNFICRNVIIGNIGDGIRLFGSHNNFIYENNIEKHENFAIVLWDSSYSNVISQNTILNNKNGIGLKRWSDNNNISDNTITGNRKLGISLSYSFRNILLGNSISNSSTGIYLGDSSENVISANYIAYNHRGIYLYDATGNIIDEDNVFLGNDEDISEGSKTFKIPGFELVLIICAMLFVLLCKRKISI